MLVQRQSEQISTVTEILNVSVSNANILLRKYKWSTERVLQDFSDLGGEEILRRAGLTSQESQQYNSNPMDEDSEYLCPLCYDDCTMADTTQLSGCGHRYCNTCWTTYISIKVRDGQSRNIKCMGEKCAMAVNESIVLKCLRDDHDLRHRYSQSVIESFVEDNTHVKWCPSTPSCGNAVISNLTATTPLVIRCSCQHEFCFACGQSPHLPCTCNMVKHWKKRCEDDSETYNWINANTKDCPGCQKPIEKNGGCNHMNCSRCNIHFCWLCVQPFKSGEYSHNCGRYTDNTPPTDKDTSRKFLERYLHYYHRFIAHQDSLKKAETKEAIEDKLREVAELRPNSSWVVSGWINNATQALQVARTTLMYSFTTAFYLFDTFGTLEVAVKEGYKNFDEEEMKIAKNRFEDKQEQLDQSTERLSELLEREASDLAYDDDLQKEIIFQTSLCDSYACALIEATRAELVIDQCLIPQLKPVLCKGYTTNSQPWTRQLNSTIFDDGIDVDDDDVSNFQRNEDMEDDGIIDVDALDDDEDDAALQQAIFRSMSYQ